METYIKGKYELNRVAQLIFIETTIASREEHLHAFQKQQPKHYRHALEQQQI